MINWNVRVIARAKLNDTERTKGQKLDIQKYENTNSDVVKIVAENNDLKT